MPRRGNEEAERQDTLKRLRDLRDYLKRQMDEAIPAYAGKLASEYRATVLEIDRLEAADGAGEESQLAQLIVSLKASRPPRADS